MHVFSLMTSLYHQDKDRTLKKERKNLAIYTCKQTFTFGDMFSLCMKLYTDVQCCI